MLINSLSLNTPANTLSYNFLSSTPQQLVIVGSHPPYEYFKDLGLGLNPLSSFRAQILALFYWLHAFSIFLIGCMLIT